MFGSCVTAPDVTLLWLVLNWKHGLCFSRRVWSTSCLRRTPLFWLIWRRHERCTRCRTGSGSDAASLDVYQSPAYRGPVHRLLSEIQEQLYDSKRMFFLSICVKLSFMYVMRSIITPVFSVTQWRLVLNMFGGGQTNWKYWRDPFSSSSERLVNGICVKIKPNVLSSGDIALASTLISSCLSTDELLLSGTRVVENVQSHEAKHIKQYWFALTTKVGGACAPMTFETSQLELSLKSHAFEKFVYLHTHSLVRRPAHNMKEI